MKYFVFLILLLSIYMNCFPQNELKNHRENGKNNLYFEYRGNGISTISFNYERFIHIKNKSFISGRMGFGFLPTKSYNQFSIPLEIDLNIKGIRSNFLEIGIGTSFTELKNPIKLYYLRIGYRYMGKRNMIFRLGFTPFVDIYPIIGNYHINPSFGISLGYSF